MAQPCLIYLHAISLVAHGTTEMMQPCLLHLHTISLVENIEGFHKGGRSKEMNAMMGKSNWRGGRTACLLHRGVKAKRTVDEPDVVVDRLWDADLHTGTKEMTHLSVLHTGTKEMTHLSVPRTAL